MKNGKAPAARKKATPSRRKPPAKGSASRASRKASREAGSKTILSGPLSRGLKVLSSFYS